MHKFLWIIVMSMFALLAAAAEEQEASGLVFATVSVKDGAATVDSVRSSLPDSVVSQLRGTITRRALQEAQSNSAETAQYAVGIEWRLVEAGGSEKLAFEFSNEAARAVEAVEPELPRSMLSINKSITANLRLGVSALGEVTLQDCQVAEARFQDACKNVSKALKRAEFLPAFSNGIGVPDTLTQVLRFDPPPK